MGGEAQVSLNLSLLVCKMKIRPVQQAYCEDAMKIRAKVLLFKLSKQFKNCLNSQYTVVATTWELKPDIRPSSANWVTSQSLNYL